MSPSNVAQCLCAELRLVTARVEGALGVYARLAKGRELLASRGPSSPEWSAERRKLLEDLPAVKGRPRLIGSQRPGYPCAHYLRISNYNIRGRIAEMDADGDQPISLEQLYGDGIRQGRAAAGSPRRFRRRPRRRPPPERWTADRRGRRGWRWRTSCTHRRPDADAPLDAAVVEGGRGYGGSAIPANPASCRRHSLIAWAHRVGRRWQRGGVGG